METIQQMVVTKQADGKFKIATMGGGKTLGTNYGTASQTVMMLEVLLKQLKAP
jgi:hypothetical protein